MCDLYRRICKRWMPQGLTLSAHAWKKKSKWVRVIDAMFFWQPQHCRTQFERETRPVSSTTQQ